MPYSTYRPELMGSAVLDGPAEIEAGSMQELTLVYTCGTFGIDDTGSLKIGFRFATDMGAVQFTDPGAPGYTTAEASTGLPLDLKWEFKRNIRPWSRSLYVGVTGDYLSPGDTITVRFGDRRQGSPGIRMQTYCESAFEFRVLVDAIATYDYVALPESPTVAIVPGAPVHWRAVGPTLTRPGEPFAIGIKAEDKWRNPADLTGIALTLAPESKIAGLPEDVTAEPGARAIRLAGLAMAKPGECEVLINTPAGVIRTNPIRAVADAPTIHAWADTHGQSNETLGTNTIAEYFAFGRDLAFLDVIGHQGNDFQITDEFWTELNETTRAFDAPGRFVAIPGYEWSANTAVGGDRNVHYLAEGERIYRSSHAQIASLATEPDDCYTAADLFARLDPEKCVVAAHVGGRYADITYAHDAALETAVEVHSSWGTFEWIVEDAFRSGYRVGIVANSDGHKGRPGSCYPGASFFGSMGGLTAFLVPELSRPAIFEAMRRRRHYGTTGARIFLDTAAEFAAPVREYATDPAAGGSAERSGTRVPMGAIVETQGDEFTFHLDVAGAAPLEEIILRDGLETLEILRPNASDAPSRRVRLVYEGAATRGRSRAVLWTGRVAVTGNTIERSRMLNNWNLDRGIRDETPEGLAFSAVTTGNYGAIDLWLAEAGAGEIAVETPFGALTLDLASWDGVPLVCDAGGLGRHFRLVSLPEAMHETAAHLSRTVATPPGSERRLYVRVQQEDGHRAWSSPIYVIRR